MDFSSPIDTPFLFIPQFKGFFSTSDEVGFALNWGINKNGESIGEEKSHFEDTNNPLYTQSRAKKEWRLMRTSLGAAVSTIRNVLLE